MMPQRLETGSMAVRKMFAAVANRYDLANHLLSAGLDFVWRRRAANLVRDWGPRSILDVACGSGDLTLALERACPGSVVVAVDFCEPMLALARRKGVSKAVLADGLRLPFEDATFDAVTIAFGLRNMESWSAALLEMSRVMRKGGHLVVLDFSSPRGPLASLYHPYLRRVLPVLAAVITGQKAAYEYLGASIERFPQGETMCRLIEQAGFNGPRSRRFTGGIVSLYTAHRS